MELSKRVGAPKQKFHAIPEEREKECPHSSGFPYSGKTPMTGPKKCPMCGEREEDVKKGVKHGRRFISESELTKVGGLYRIRDNYEPVWRMEADEEGRRYIIRADDAGAEAERLHISESACAEDNEKTSNAVEEAKAFKIIKAGATYVVWECEACSTPNMTKFGNNYECDQCHKKYADVLQVEQPRRRVYTRAEVQASNPEFATRMGRLGINKIHANLLQVWAREMMKCEKCGEETEGTKLCLSCSPKGTLFKQKESARMSCWNCLEAGCSGPPPKGNCKCKCHTRRKPAPTFREMSAGEAKPGYIPQSKINCTNCGVGLPKNTPLYQRFCDKCDPIVNPDRYRKDR